LLIIPMELIVLFVIVIIIWAMIKSVNKKRLIIAIYFISHLVFKNARNAFLVIIYRQIIRVKNELKCYLCNL
jgi:hypothetical protein